MLTGTIKTFYLVLWFPCLFLLVLLSASSLDDSLLYHSSLPFLYLPALVFLHLGILLQNLEKSSTWVDRPSTTRWVGMLHKPKREQQSGIFIQPVVLYTELCQGFQCARATSNKPWEHTKWKDDWQQILPTETAGPVSLSAKC